MTVWNIHLLNARHKLTPILPELRATAREAVDRVSQVTDLPRFDLVIRGQRGGGIPEWGVGGLAPEPGVIEVTINPERFSSQYLLRTLVHEMHHLIRWDGPGYGKSLGAALVSEGLAGHFTLQILGGKPDPWDGVTPAQGLARRAVTEWARLDYDHAEWFFGKGSLRKWSGYGLGHRLLAEYFAQYPDETAASLAHRPADEFQPSMRRLAAAEQAGKDQGGSENSPVA